MNKYQYTVKSEDELWDFDTEMAYMLNEDNYTVYCEHTDETFKPVYCVRSNGDIDGFEGWD